MLHRVPNKWKAHPFRIAQWRRKSGGPGAKNLTLSNWPESGIIEESSKNAIRWYSLFLGLARANFLARNLGTEFWPHPVVLGTVRFVSSSPFQRYQCRAVSARANFWPKISATKFWPTRACDPSRESSRRVLFGNASPVALRPIGSEMQFSIRLNLAPRVARLHHVLVEFGVIIFF